MANKRMFNKTVIDSDAFMDMPQTTQNLYFHLNMRADDDGFIDNPKTIMRSIGSAQNDLEVLLAKRYLLSFDSGVVVIKHWKLHNTIRKDRYKPTLYLEEVRTLLEKENGAYTEAYKVLDQKEIESWQPVGNQLATNGTHRLDKIRLDKIRLDIENTEKKEPLSSFKNNSKSFQPGGKQKTFQPGGSQKKPVNNPDTIGAQIGATIDHWNKYDTLPRCRYNIATLPDVGEVSNVYNAYGKADIERAIDNLSKFILLEPSKFRPSSFSKFLIKSIDRWTDDCKPWERYEEEKTDLFSEEEAAAMAKEIFG